MKPWGILAAPSNAEPATDPSVSQEGYVSGAEPSSETWTPNFDQLPIYEQIAEIHDHVTKLIALVSTMRAEQQERDERQPGHGVDLRDRGQTDMSKPR